MSTAAVAPPVTPVSGVVEAPFDQVADMFARTVARQGGGGSALCVYREGRPVLDLIGGTYRPDYLQQVFSVSKGIVAVAAAVAHHDQMIDLDAPIADYWREFRRPSTAMITARMILAHRSGLSAVATPLSLADLVSGELDRAVARQEPYWEPGTDHGYAAFTFGALMAGVFRHGAGVEIADFLRTRISAPLGLELWLGAPADQLDRIAPTVFSPPASTPAQARAMSSPRFIPDGSFVEINADPVGFFGDPRVRTARWPAMSVVTTARDLARAFAATLDAVGGVRLLDAGSLTAMTASRSHGPDRMVGHVTHFGSGVELPHTHLPFLGERSFGHEGAGGSVVCADPELGVALAFTTSKAPAVVGVSDQALLLLGAVRHCLTHLR
ncbi:serine hydrolase domain-containing protein [Nocardia farcinica]|uniref:Beta-lactamase/D-alanine carboxypeptidase n=1 Tax=Nocardia farcinica TaxID=37329 RepID=A0A0H5P1L5_NOCFR|nr:serine hydrolase domain-containing protein [Nocardia farcinica]AXK85154.1 class A beta-lactamase-related serine hydrolase [Nocardia farcinica]MBF6359490.1 beta-lactamase family protein [Nocardia farcinica]PFX05084.1 hypothetical protein CJ469_00494 [Nocardia farcinica]PFX10354.1 hypothetical protein CJ468_00020 [Nocardia farcinica]CRY76336.1 beta-lactamase/D-alanine carboxypeptidase [Nocardia farcinica]